MAGQFGILTFDFACRNGIGAISVPGTMVGDVLIWTTYNQGTNNPWQPPGAFYEKIITVADEVQQKDASDASTWTGSIMVVRGVAI